MLKFCRKTNFIINWCNFFRQFDGNCKNWVVCSGFNTPYSQSYGRVKNKKWEGGKARFSIFKGIKFLSIQNLDKIQRNFFMFSIIFSFTKISHFVIFYKLANLEKGQRIFSKISSKKMKKHYVFLKDKYTPQMILILHMNMYCHILKSQGWQIVPKTLRKRKRMNGMCLLGKAMQRLQIWRENIRMNELLVFNIN